MSLKGINNEREKYPPIGKEIFKYEGNKIKSIHTLRYAFVPITLIPNPNTIGKGVSPKSWISGHIYEILNAQVKTKSSAKRYKFLKLSG